MTGKNLGVMLVLACACGAHDSDPTSPSPDAMIQSDAATACQPESLSDLCAHASYQCGAASFTDRCGNHVEGSCGSCSSGTCGGDGVDHVCSMQGWRRITWPTLDQMIMLTMWSTPGSSTVWAAGGFLGSGEIWKIDGFQLASTGSLPTISALQGVGTNIWGVGNAGLIIRGSASGSFSYAPSSGLENYDLHDVWAFSADDLWVTTNGINSVAHWNGAIWDFDSLPSTPLFPNCAGLWGSASNDLWAACTKGELFHWNGSEWAKASSPTTYDLQDIYGFAANDIWAVGDGNTVLHYDGAGWHKASVPPGGGLGGVWGAAPNDVYAVGARALTSGGHVLHFNGSSWTEVLTTADPGSFGQVTGAAGRVWVVGYPKLLYTYP